MKKNISAYIDLTKPRIITMVLVTSYLGYYLGLRSQNSYMSDFTSYVTLLYLLLGTLLTSACASVFNQLIEWKQDSLMDRTKGRPLPIGVIGRSEALFFGLVLGIAGFLVLFYYTNSITAYISALTVILYLFVYTPSKKLTVWNTIIGSIPGALPPVGGWTAATGHLEFTAWILFGILFCWQMPHFLAIAIIYARDYEKGGFKMLPSIYPESKHTSYIIMFFTISLFIVSLGLYIVKAVGVFYAVASAILGIAFFIIALKVILNSNIHNAKKLMVASIIYLPLLLIIILLERYVN